MTIIDESSILSHGILKKIFDSYPNPAYIWKKLTDTFILVDYNRAAKNNNPLKLNHLLNESASKFFSNHPLIHQKIKECVVNKQAEIKEMNFRLPSNNKQICYSINFFFVPNDLVVLYLNDITNQKLIERDLKNSEERYKHLFEQAPFPIILFDNKANLIDCNNATEKIFGYSKKDLINQNYLLLKAYPPKYIPILKERLKKLWSEVEVDPLTLKLYKKDGDPTWVISMLSKVNIKGLTMFQAILIDITESKKANQLIKHKLEIEKVISSISSRFISNINIDDAIDESLIDMGRLIGAKRAYLLLNSEDRTVEFYSQVSCSEKKSINKIDLVNLNIDDFPYLLKEYEKKGFIYVNVTDLPEEESHTKKQFEKLQIESLLVFPIIIQENHLGFIGFDDIEESTHWCTDDFTLLKTSSEIIGNALERKWGEKTLKSTNQLLTAILCSLTECIILIDKDYNIIWVNNETQNLLNSQFIGKKCYEFLMNSKKPCKHCIARKTFLDGTIHENEYAVNDKAGNTIKYWATTNVASKDKNDDIELVILILRIINDLT